MPLPQDDLVVAVQVESGRIAFRLSGEIDESNADAIPHAVLAAGIEGGHVVIDLADVTFMDSSGLSAILRCRAGLQHKGVAVEVRNANGQVRRLFEITSLTGLLG